jgi:hypothetical protein
VSGLIVVAFAFLQPLVPALERAAAAITAGAKATKTKAVSCITCACCRGKRHEKPTTSNDEPAAVELHESSDAASAAEELVAPASKSQQHRHRHAAAQDGAEHHAEGDAAFAVGNMAALMGDDGGDEEGDEDDDEGVAGHMDFMDTMEEMLGKLERFGKIIIKCVVACVRFFCVCSIIQPAPIATLGTDSCFPVRVWHALRVAPAVQLLPNRLHVPQVPRHPVA